MLHKVVLARPGILNAYSFQMMEEIKELENVAIANALQLEAA